MNICFEPALLEEILFLEMHRREDCGDSASVRSFHVRREAAYHLPPGRQQEQAFAEQHRKIFLEWGLDAAVAECLVEFPELFGQIASVHVASALSRKDEGADLHQRMDTAGGFSLILRVKPENYRPGDPLRFFLRQEFQHVADMLDKGFGYERDLPVEGLAAAAANLFRDRYRVVWNTSVDGRLVRRGLLLGQARTSRQSEFVRVFPRLDCADADRDFERLWNEDRPTHAGLVSLCRPEGGPLAGPRPGSPCPLCGFSTFDWADPGHALPEALVEAIRRDFPHWLPAHSLCNQCLTLYKGAASLAQPPRRCQTVDG